jgi:hypothetical protein
MEAPEGTPHPQGVHRAPLCVLSVHFTNHPDDRLNSPTPAGLSWTKPLDGPRVADQGIRVSTTEPSHEGENVS